MSGQGMDNQLVTREEFGELKTTLQTVLEEIRELKNAALTSDCQRDVRETSIQEAKILEEIRSAVTHETLSLKHTLQEEKIFMRDSLKYAQDDILARLSDLQRERKEIKSSVSSQPEDLQNSVEHGSLSDWSLLDPAQKSTRTESVWSGYDIDQKLQKFKEEIAIENNQNLERVTANVADELDEFRSSVREATVAKVGEVYRHSRDTVSMIQRDNRCDLIVLSAIMVFATTITYIGVVYYFSECESEVGGMLLTEVQTLRKTMAKAEEAQNAMGKNLREVLRLSQKMADVIEAQNVTGRNLQVEMLRLKGKMTESAISLKKVGEELRSQNVTGRNLQVEMLSLKGKMTESAISLKMVGEELRSVRPSYIKSDIQLLAFIVILSLVLALSAVLINRIANKTEDQMRRMGIALQNVTSELKQYVTELKTVLETEEGYEEDINARINCRCYSDNKKKA